MNGFKHSLFDNSQNTKYKISYNDRFTAGTQIGPFFAQNKEVEFSCLGPEVEFKTLKGNFLDFENVFKILK